VLLYGFGLHVKLDPEIVREKLIRNVDWVAGHHPQTTQVFLPRHAPHMEKKPPQYRESQGPEVVLRFNNRLTEDIRQMNEGREPERRIGIFDTYNLTVEATSFDGSHYGQRVNVEKAQLVVNYLDKLRREKGFTPLKTDV
jgi:hypothetical protein